eukprot:scaffold86487_cov40-Prasinocladus_malaysianus.AAC.3
MDFGPILRACIHERLQLVNQASDSNATLIRRQPIDQNQSPSHPEVSHRGNTKLTLLVTGTHAIAQCMRQSLDRSP